MSDRIVKFFKSPMNQTGIVAILSLLPGLLMQYADHSVGLSAIVSTLAFAIVKIMLPDNAVLQQDIDQLVEDAVKAYAARSPASFTAVVDDAAKAVTDGASIFPKFNVNVPMPPVIPYKKDVS